MLAKLGLGFAIVSSEGIATGDDEVFLLQKQVLEHKIESAASQSAANQCLRFCGGKADGCTFIAEGDGDCDRDSDCQPGLRCGTDNCHGNQFATAQFDCCYRPDKPVVCGGQANGCTFIAEGDGDCDRDSDCQPGLKCGVDNCDVGSVFTSSDDCCYKPEQKACNGQADGCVSIAEGDGDCDKDSDCQPGLRCGVDNCDVGSVFTSSDDCCYKPEECPAPSNPCLGGANGCNGQANGCTFIAEGDGDCDRDSDCMPGLVCGTDNCDVGNVFTSSDDCCFKPEAKACNGQANGCTLIGEGDGDCDRDSDCMPGLVCGTDNCDVGNVFTSSDDCCYKPEANVCGGKHDGCTLIAEGDGDCDKDSDCMPGLKCGVDNCANTIQFNGNSDCCYRPVSCSAPPAPPPTPPTPAGGGDTTVCPGCDSPGGDTDVTDADCFDADRGFGPDFSCANTEMYCSSDSGDGLTVGACCPTKCKKEFEIKKKNSNPEKKGKNEAERKAKRAGNEGSRKKNEKERKKKRKDTEWNTKRDAKETQNKNAEDERKTKRGWKEGSRKNERGWKKNRRERRAAADQRERARKETRNKNMHGKPPKPISKACAKNKASYAKCKAKPSCEKKFKKKGRKEPTC